MPCVRLARDAQELDAIAEAVGRFDVFRRDGLDALDVDFVERDAGREGEAGQQGELVRGVEAADVEGRIGFRVTLRLRFLQDVGEGALLALHLGQDVIAGAVQDAVDALDLVGAERLAQGLDDRDAAGDGRFEVEGDAVLLGALRKIEAVLGEQRLVGGDDVLAGIERRLDGGFGDAAVAAHQLDEDVDRGVLGEHNRIGEELRFLRHRALLFGLRLGGDAGHFDAASGDIPEPASMRGQQVEQAAADGAEAGDADFQIFSHF